MLCAVVFIGTADIFHHAGTRHIPQENSDLDDALQQRPHKAAVVRDGGVGDELSDEELRQEHKQTDGNCNAHHHANGHDDAEKLVSQLFIQPLFKAVHLLGVLFVLILRHLFFRRLGQAAVAVLHGQHKVKAAPKKRAFPVPGHILAVVFFPGLHVDLAVGETARHSAGVSAFHHNALDQRLSADLGHMFRVFSGLFCHVLSFPRNVRMGCRMRICLFFQNGSPESHRLD